jgi:hypothetical protein
LASGLWLLAIARVSAGNFYAGTSPSNVPWPGGLVPYEFTNSLTAAQTNTYFNGLREWELVAGVKFVPHTNQAHWILFTYNTNWIDNVSASTNPQVVTIASLSRAQVCHEMGHSFGFTHENIRPDQTNYLTVLTNNVAPGYLSFFQVDPTSVTNDPYDFESVMHLGWDFGSTSLGVLATQQPKPPYFPRCQFRMGNYCLSPGDRAALAYLYGPPAVPLTNLVTTTADVGPGSLRAAIYYATDHPGTTIRFNIVTNDPGYSNGVFNIHLTGLLPPLVASGTVIDGSTEPGFAGKPLIFVDGSQMIPEAYAPGAATGLLIYSSGNQIKNLSFSGFNWNGLTLLYPDATNNTISGCWFGLNFTGTNAAPNAYQGILIAAGASGNLIGGTNALARNVLSGNSQYGIFITDSNTTGNVVLGNYIGTDATGMNPLPNAVAGVTIDTGSSANLIGGTNAGAGNLISGNLGNGILMRGSNVVNNTVQGNFIGTDATGMNPLPNAVAGVTIDTGSSANLIGGTVAGARNVISGNLLSYDCGVFLAGSGTSGNVVEGNYIGLGVNGLTAVPNYYGMVCSDGAAGNTFGGTVAGARNVISGNSSYGMLVRYSGTSGNVVEGNYAGLDASGGTAVPNDFGIICYGGATNNLIGGTSPGAANFVSGNYYGVCLADPNTSGNVVEGNFIGTDDTGTNGVGNFDNVALQNNATGNFIGGVSAGAGNVIAFATGNGVVLYQAGTTNNSIRGNSIFSNNYLGIDLNGDGVTPNHTGFLAGPNDLQNFPVITNALVSGGNTIISGSLNSTPASNFFVDIYRNRNPDPSGYGEGQFYFGTVSVNTDGSGNVGFKFTAAGNYPGQYFTATASAATGDTSEFGADLPAVNGPSAQFTGPFLSGAGGFAFSLSLQTNFSYHIQAATNLVAPVTWTDLTNFTATNSPFSFTDHSATNFRVRFYRVMSP